MKDLYSFHESEEDLKKYYEVVKQAYLNIYQALGLADYTYIALASGGDFTKDYSHEFQVKCEAGEDTLFRVPSTGVTYNKEVAPSRSAHTIQQEEHLTSEKIHTPNAVSVIQVVQLLNTTPANLVKTMIYTRGNGTHFAVAVRGDYALNDIKIEMELDVQGIKLATEEEVVRLTGAKVGYAGVKGLEGKIDIFYDDSLIGACNMIMGACETDYHLTNVNFERDLKSPAKFYDFKMAQEGDLFPATNELYEVFKASEVGNIFPLNTKFSKAFGYTYTSAVGDEQLVYMGCYGIGTTRLLGVIAEVFNDAKGLMWPAAIAPYTVHLVGLNLEDTDTRTKAQAVYKLLQEANIEVVFDDRETTTAGEKFADADLIGCPIRAVVSKKTAEGSIEMKLRNSTTSTVIAIPEMLEHIKKLEN
jgi:prolyl-tRNA synthetase